MPVEQRTAKDVFRKAADYSSAADRENSLNKACQGDIEQRQRVEPLPAAQSQSTSCLDSPVAKSFDPRPLVITPGTPTGYYIIREQIGKEGFGMVFMADQGKPVRRKVALKIIKPGMDTRAVVGRLEAEWQAMVLMDHRHISMVSNAGATEAGRRYVVMELKHGVPITEYSDHCPFSTRERLELSRLICQTVQHTHRKGVIHCDPKLSNVLVPMQQGTPAPKIIDFGVGKSIDQQFTKRTLTNGFFQMIGTPINTRLGQAERSPLGADTRSDVDSLGVLLYKLLTGTISFGLHSAGYDERNRIILEKEPPRPSARLSTLMADRATTVANGHRSNPGRLAQALRGELDWIVMTCWEKDRILNWLWLSLVCHQLDQTDEARKWLKRAQEWLDQQQGRLPCAAERRLALYPYDWLEAQVLRRKSEAILGDASGGSEKS